MTTSEETRNPRSLRRTVEIAAREAWSIVTKVVVRSHNPNVDAIGTIVIGGAIKKITSKFHPAKIRC